MQAHRTVAPGLGRKAGGVSLPVPREFQAASRSKITCAARRKASQAQQLHNNGDMSPDERIKMENLLASLQRVQDKYGKSSVFRLGDNPKAAIETFSSGCLTLDVALGGGMPRGRIVEIYGPESSGKTTLALHSIAEVQKIGGKALLIDAEHAFDMKYAEALGVNTTELYVSQPDHGEAALDTADEMARSGAMDLIVIDSVSALIPKAELEGDVGQQTIGLQARMLSQALRKLVGSASKCNCTLIFINQLRMKIGVLFGNPETTSGGNALKYYCSVRIDVRKKEKLGPQDGATGIRVNAKIVKNKVAPPFREASFAILFSSGIDKLGGLLDAGELAGVIAKKGAWFYYDGKQLGQGREKSMEALRSDEELRKRIEADTRAALSQDPDLLADPEEAGLMGEDGVEGDLDHDLDAAAGNP